MKKLQLLVFLLVNAYSFSQIGIGTTTPNASAVLDLTSTTKGLLPPRLTQVQMNAIPTPAEALTVYCTNCTPKGLYIFDGTTWVALGGATATTVSVTCTGFTGSYCTAALSSTTYVVTMTNNDFSSKQITPLTTDLTLSGLTSLAVASVSPNTVQTINAGANLVITYTISGTPAAAGTLTGTWAKQGLTCSSTVAVATAKAVTAASSLPALCISSPLTAITHTTSGTTTGIGTPTGLPAGVTAAWASNTITISGTPTASGTFNYSIPVLGCGDTVNATGAITVNPALVAGAASATRTVLINTVLTNVTHSTTAATGIGAATGLPPGVIATWAANTITISGTPTESGTFAYSIPLVGICGTANATGTITVLSTGNGIIQSVLTTSLVNFNAAANGTAVSITQTEWDALNMSLASSGGGKAGCSNTQLTTTLNTGNSIHFAANYTDHTFSNLTTTPANKRIYGFALNIRTVFGDGIGRIKTFVGDAGTDLHTNNLAITNTTAPVYYVIKTPPAVSANTQIIGSYISVDHFKFNTGVSNGYRYLYGNFNTATWNNSTNTGIPCIQFAYGGN